jgi:hypothetical protein
LYSDLDLFTGLLAFSHTGKQAKTWEEAASKINPPLLYLDFMAITLLLKAVLELLWKSVGYSRKAVRHESPRRSGLDEGNLPGEA